MNDATNAAIREAWHAYYSTLTTSWQIECLYRAGAWLFEQTGESVWLDLVDEWTGYMAWVTQPHVAKMAAAVYGYEYEGPEVIDPVGHELQWAINLEASFADLQELDLDFDGFEAIS